MPNTIEWVYFFYRDSREAAFLTELLKPFTGVLVSDFFTGYDSPRCLQQKCLIHLLRDLNEDVFKHPFDEELVKLAQRFASLLRTVVGTVDKYGLQSKHLRRHRGEIDTFFAEVCAGEAQSDLRFQKHQLHRRSDAGKSFAPHRRRFFHSQLANSQAGTAAFRPRFPDQ